MPKSNGHDPDRAGAKCDAASLRDNAGVGAKIHAQIKSGSEKAVECPKIGPLKF
jgi:hypothetical protein